MPQHRTPRLALCRADESKWALVWLIALAVAQAVLYAAIAWLSRKFVHGEGYQPRPILAVIGLLVTCFGLYVVSLVVALRIPPARWLVGVILVSAAVFRAILLPTEPIQEIDIYRYLWDGAVLSHGGNPFRYSPTDVLAVDLAAADDPHRTPPELARLARLGDRDPALGTVLRRIHYPELTTVYPPVSQVVFALGDRLAPTPGSVWGRMTVLKGVLLGFDLLAIGFIWLILSETSRHAGWLVAYAWCPLVMKEFANSGHLDAIAVCLATAAVWCILRALRGGPHRHWWWEASGATLLGLAVGAKLYPLVLVPLAAVMVAATRGARRGMALAVIALCSSFASLGPMLVTQPAAVQGPSPSEREPTVLPDGQGVDPSAGTNRATSRESGLAAFLSRWQMNDFLFGLILENTIPRSCITYPAPWFSIASDPLRETVVQAAADALSIPPRRAAFLLARLVTGTLFIGIAVGLARWAARQRGISAFLEAAFLTLAWFWLLSPTQNPWYWTWALPLLPFARGRAWFAMSGLVFAYYLRFWLVYHFSDERLLATPYAGAHFFDFVVTWMEFGPWFVWLGGGALIRWRWRRVAVGPGEPNVSKLTDRSAVVR